MENKHVGWLLIGIAVCIAIIIIIFSSTAKDVLVASCPLVHQGTECPAYKTITLQTTLAIAVLAIVVLIGIFLIFSKPREKVIMKYIEKKARKKEISTLGFTADEKKVLHFIMEQRAIFQAELIEKTSIGKVKMSRILDMLEGKGIVERKRRGMNNVVVMKE